MLSIAILSLLLVLIDQISKKLVINYLNKEILIIKNIFCLTYTKNNGAAFSILNGKRLLLILMTILIIGVLIYYIVKNRINNKMEILAFSLVIGGSLGNLIDRIVRGFVVDFISIKIFGYNFPVFNIADSLICIGVFLLFIIGLRKEKSHDNR